MSGDGSAATLGDITANDKFAFGSDTVQTLNKNGGTSGLYTYCGAAAAAEYGITQGWYDYNEVSSWDGTSALTSYNALPLPAGSGFVVQTGTAGAQIVVPGAN